MANATTYTDAELAKELRHQIKELEDSHRRRRNLGTLTSLESGEILTKLRAIVGRLDQLASFSPLQQQFLQLVHRITPVQEAEPLASGYATASQREELSALVLHPVITRPELTKVLLNINRYDAAEAATTITRLRKAIEERSATATESTHPALQGDGRQQALDELQALLNNELVTAEERRKAGLTIGSLNEAALRLKIQITREKLEKRAAAYQVVGSAEIVQPIESAA